MDGSTVASLGDKNLEELRKEVDSHASDVYNFTYENGRRYASTELGHYYMPNDEPEIQRLNQQHWMLTVVKEGRLHNAPLPDRPLKILDVGCGSGIWAIQMAEEYPSALITGMDISPIQPAKKPANVDWIVHDMEKDWPVPEDYFDFIHLSLVHGCVADWRSMMNKIVGHLAPGGVVEHQEFALGSQYAVDDSGKPMPFSEKVEELPPLTRWSRMMSSAGEKRGRPLQLGPKLRTFQSEAGLLEVTENVYSIPVGTWPADKKRRMIGAHIAMQTLTGIEGYTTVMFTKVLGWSLEDTQAFITEIKQDLQDNAIHKMIDFHVVYGTKAGGEADEQRVRGWQSSDTTVSVGQLALGAAIGAAVTSVAAVYILRRR